MTKWCFSIDRHTLRSFYPNNSKNFEQIPPCLRIPGVAALTFAMVFSQKDIAKPFLEAILGIKIHELRNPEPEKTIEVNPLSKGVRFDVFVKESGPNGETLRSFDIEMQMKNTHEGRAVYRFKNLEVDDPEIEMGDQTFKNFLHIQ